MAWAEGDRLLYDRSVPVTFVKALGEQSAVIRVGADTRVVDVLSLRNEEA